MNIYYAYISFVQRSLSYYCNRFKKPNRIEDEDDGESRIMDEVDGNRIVFINKPQPDKFCPNRISTGKYNFLTFFPSFLFEQFRRWANIFFLFIALMQQIPDVSPTGRYTTLVPLLFILSVSAIKEIIEDVKRHRADDEVNNRIVDVLRNGQFQPTKWRHVTVGDIVKVVNNTFFPADLVLLSSSEPQAMSFIETANLDGETNLKIRQGLRSTSTLVDRTALNDFTGTVVCEPPNRHLYEFTGAITTERRGTEPLGPDQILLRGAMLRNTLWIYGLVIYTGHETKLMKNSTSAPLKRSTVDKLTNTQVLMLFGILIAMCAICTVFNHFWMQGHSSSDWYIGLEEIAYRNIAYNFLTFIILFNNLIPISLQVTLEMVRFIQAIFINMDVEMYYEESDTPAMARTSNLNEELGQIKYVFSDKTGTLTRNVMEFKKCAIGGKIYSVAETPEESALIRDLRSQHGNAHLIEDMLVLLSVCHTVIPERMPDGTINYHAASPDEQALITGASRFGYVFDSRTPEHIEVDALGERRRYEILQVLEFTSARKRMSVVVRDEKSGTLRLFCKGADTVIYERLSNRGRQNSDDLLVQLEHFATEGLRTLCFAAADLEPSFYRQWKKQHHEASVAIRDREARLEAVAELIERDLCLVGATAIEDRLQDGVPETIDALMRANIHVWVLTGDKQETAINIGYSCKLITLGTPLRIMNTDGLDATRDNIHEHKLFVEQLAKRRRSPGAAAASSSTATATATVSDDVCLVIDGKTLKYALDCELQRDFLELCVSCKAVICCRVSPMQKAEVVELVTKHTRSITLAIGDGANDVAMIQKAHVGVGISGVEGLQAACASDYSIAQFRFLQRLLFVHGAWNYSRISKLILYCFYKNICLYVIELWFAIYSGWSGQILFERWTIGLYNVFFTALPPFAMGLFDRSCSAEVMMQHPQLYRPSQEARMFNVRVFWIWIANAMLHSACLYWFTQLACQYDVLWSSGMEGGYLAMGNCVYTYVVTAVCFKAGLVTNSWTWLTHCAIWGSILLWFLFVAVYSNVWPFVNVGAIMLGMDRMLATSPVFWMGLLVIPVSTIVPDLVVLVIKNSLFKSPMDAFREKSIRDPAARQNDVQMEEGKASLSETSRLLKGVRSVFTSRHPRTGEELELQRHGFAFSQEEGGTISQEQVIRAYDTNRPKPEGN